MAAPKGSQSEEVHSIYWYAVIRRTDVEIGLGMGIGDMPVYTINCGDLSAVVSDEPCQIPSQDVRANVQELVLERLAKTQRRVEAIVRTLKICDSCVQLSSIDNLSAEDPGTGSISETRQAGGK